MNIQVVYNGVVYDSVLGLFKKLNIENEYKAFMSWKDRNILSSKYYSINDYIKAWIDKRTSISYHGKKYTSVRDVFKELGKQDKFDTFANWSYARMKRDRDLTIEEKIDTYLDLQVQNRNVSYHGRTFNSIKDIFLFYGWSDKELRAFNDWKAYYGKKSFLSSAEKLIDEFTEYRRKRNSCKK